jgi:restriction system protein
MPFPSFYTFFVPIVHSLRARGGSATIDEMEEAVAAASNLSEDQLAQLHGDGPRTEFSYRLAWART